MIDIDAFLAEAAEQPPCGPNLEYDPAFVALETLAQRKAEQQFGDTVIPAEEPDWRRVREAAGDLLLRSKDLRVAVLLVRAWTNIDGLAGFNAGMDLLRGLVERYWRDLLPPLDADEDDDPLFRLNALAPLADGDMLPRDLRNAPVLSSRATGPLSLRDLELNQGRLAPREGEAAPTDAQLRGAIDAALAESADALVPAGRMLAAIRALSAALTEHVGDRAPDLGPLLSAAQVVAPLASAAGAGEAAAPADETGAGDAAPAAAPAAPGKAYSAAISSRQDVARALDLVCEYLERTEPSNPAPLLIRRAQSLMDKSFLDIMRDLAPDGLRQAEVIAGTQAP